MRKLFNPIYLFAACVIFFLWKFSANYSQQAVLFYGFAENKETEINLDHSVEVNKIFVSPGQKVMQGDLLAEVSHIEFEHDIDKELNNIEELKIKENLWQNNLQRQVTLLKTNFENELKEIEIEISEIEAEKKYQESLFEDLKTVSANDNKQTFNPLVEKILSLRKEKDLIKNKYKVEHSNLQKEVNSPSNPYQQRIKSIQTNIELKKKKLEKLSLTAPTNGLIGNIHCKEAENITSFKTLITFYEPNPTLVKAYVHEDLIVHVSIDDSLRVKSTNNQDFTCKGTIVGLGSRIVEIPERLRKIPEMKTYGREVLVKIPAENKFLQKEKVVMEFLNGKTYSIFEFEQSKNSLAKKRNLE